MNFLTVFDLCASDMADGLNHARAIRTAEVIGQFRDVQHRIAQCKATPSETDKDGEGFKLLEQCSDEGHDILKAPFAATSEPPSGDLEKEKSQLKQVMLDAAARRFMAQRVYLKATAAMRWINSRSAILQDGVPTPANAPALSIVDITLRTELSTITNSRVVRDLLVDDQLQGKWTQEDPDLASIQRFIASKHSQSV